jgi:hypothetical protein
MWDILTLRRMTEGVSCVRPAAKPLTHNEYYVHFGVE